ncbi:hypothetical protein AKJ37_04875 [candidate division MSBL1 archaeon SCGC-AAA259I09]|uniref:Uncharacterized protein n=2 Tax=candidate division MSBL1 TaxID=215777 RepID=A0A133UR39_9EURY|nr:hypothetical protein AKJ37_04875 [candidate division MSBL1 archaeon SCGC-AAA259I09]KXA99652.1 hypothetical protein AKJ40_02685 [candidate division MSBL1 archaeon SCGC-AAA259M10]
MSLEDFFLEKIGISEEYWEDSEGELREASEKSGASKFGNIYGRGRLDRFSPGLRRGLPRESRERTNTWDF